MSSRIYSYSSQYNSSTSVPAGVGSSQEEEATQRVNFRTSQQSCRLRQSDSCVHRGRVVDTKGCGCKRIISWRERAVVRVGTYDTNGHPVIFRWGGGWLLCLLCQVYVLLYSILLYQYTSTAAVQKCTQKHQHFRVWVLLCITAVPLECACIEGVGCAKGRPCYHTLVPTMICTCMHNMEYVLYTYIYTSYDTAAVVVDRRTDSSENGCMHPISSLPL